MIVLIDGIRYRLITPENEAELEATVQKNYEHIFGPDSFYFDEKKLIKSKSGVASIPDGYAIYFDPKPKWCIVEVELASHPIYDHLIPQLTKFNRGIDDSSTRKKLVEIFYKTMTAEELLKVRLQQKIGSGEVYKFLSDLISEPPLILVVIDRRTTELEEAVRDIRGDVKVVEFKIFQREGFKEKLRAYVFDPIVKRKSISEESDIDIPPVGPKIRGKEYGEDFHTKGKPPKIIELYRSVDNFCLELDQKNVQKKCQKKYIKYSCGRGIFCSMHLWNSLIRIWLKLKFKDLDNPQDCVRDVTSIGHWGVGDVEVAIKSSEELEIAKRFIRKSFEENT